MSVRGTGFELGLATGTEPWKEQFLADYSDLDTVDFVPDGTSGISSHSGSFHCQVGAGAATSNFFSLAVPDGTTNELYLSFFMDLTGSGKGFQVGFTLSDTTQVFLQKDQGVGNTTFDAYVGASNVASGSEDVPNGDWGLVEIYVKIDGSAGIIQSAIDSVSDISFSGNTQPGASTTITEVFFEFSLSIANPPDGFVIDDITMDTDAPPGDVRYSRVYPNANTATIEWTPNVGLDNYEVVDEVNDTTYVFSSTEGDQDFYDLIDWTNGFQIYMVQHYVRAQYVTAAADLDILLVSGATTNTDNRTLTASLDFYWSGYRTDPNTGGQWLTAALDALIIGQEAGAIGGGGSIQVALNQLEVGYSQETEDSKGGILILAMDVDLQSGHRMYATSWRNSTLYLNNYSTVTLAQNAQTSFGPATSTEITNRTYYLACFCPPYWATASFGNYVFVFGRWNLGSVKHLALSTDGGLNFGANLGDATWGTGWVGAFFAEDDGVTYYAFVNGGSRALWRSTNAGASWSNLSSLPFDVEHGAVSKHPDGRILISNRSGSSQTAAYAVGPDYTTWVDATGSPSFPASTPGNGSNAIIWIT